jgi:nanoRNase/pAp phosphatase (c-di-AMP/oligoRNAs hydrolase)
MRLVTRGDLDGLTCAVLISLNEAVEDFLLAHPQDITDGRLDVQPTDILANLPYHPRCALWFDHHMHTATPAAPPPDFRGSFGEAPSAARLVYEYYGGEEKMPQLADVVRETDRLDSADLTAQDILAPAGYIQLGLTLDSRTGLGTFEDYFFTLMALLLRNTPVKEILAHPQVNKRCEVMAQEDAAFREALRDHSTVDGNVVITDFRDIDHPPIGNRFLVYALYPEVNVSVRLHWGPGREYPMLLVGHSVLNRTCRTNVGELCARYGGGGHRGAGSVPLMDEPDQQVQLIVAELKANG